MKRDPSLHITKSDLIEVLNAIPYDKRMAGKVLADRIFEDSQKYQIRDRYLEVMKLKAKVKKKVQKSLEADQGMTDGMVEKFNRLLTSIRQSDNMFAKVRVVRKDSKDYILLKEVAKQAHEFAEHFDISPRVDGYKEYIELGMSLMGRYGLNRFKTYDKRIWEIFESRVKVYMDEKQEDTRKVFEVWRECMKEVGMEDMVFIDNDPVKYSHFVYAREAADQNRADYEDWVRGQFEGLAFMSAIPELMQFYGENAKLRWERYLRSVEMEEEETDGLDQYYEKYDDGE